MNTKAYNVKQIFAVDVNPKLTVTGRAPDPNNAYIPNVNQHYRFGRELLSDILGWHSASDESLFLSGPTGCGKSSIVLQVAARLNIPVLCATGHSRLEMPELVGYNCLREGTTEFIYGPLSTAMKLGAWFLLDEGDLLDPATAAGANGVIEGRPLVIPENGGEVINGAPGFRFIIAANSNGAGDPTGLYQGVLRQNAAYMDRFWSIAVTYPEPSQEDSILATTVPAITEPIRKAMISFANEIRKLHVAGEMEVTFSTRTLIRWAGMIHFFRSATAAGKSPMIHALDRAIAFRASDETRIAMHELAQRVFG